MQDYKRFSTRTSGLFTSLIEVWKDIEGYEGSYQVSSFGRVKSLARLVPGKGGSLRPVRENIMSFFVTRDGYYRVGLRNGKKKCNHSVHCLVARAFIPKVDGKETVNHIDGDKAKNCVSNLEWADSFDQARHAIATGLKSPRGGIKYSKKFKQEVYDYYHSNSISINALAVMFNMDRALASTLVREGVKEYPSTKTMKDGSTVKMKILTKEQFEDIKRLRSEGWSVKKIMEEFGTSKAQVYRILNGKIRKSDID